MEVHDKSFAHSPLYYEKVIHALIKISSLVTQEIEITELYKSIHESIETIISSKNIAIFLYDEKQQTITFDYFVDEKDQENLNGRTMKLGEGVSSYVIRNNIACLFTPEDINKLIDQGKINNALGSQDYHSWMGAPISHGSRVFGIVIVQSYDSEIIYSKSDLQVLNFVASHLATLFELREMTAALQLKNSQVEKSLALIKQQNQDLNSLVIELQETQSELIQKEKLASLGGLVAGVAHEINTPVGICLTGASNLQEEVKIFETKCEQDTATQKDFENFMLDIAESSEIVCANAQKAAELIHSFKSIAVAQTSENTREIDLGEYIKDVLNSLKPMLKKHKHVITVDCPNDTTFETNPGSISQILTNLINNSIIHGFDGIESGEIKIKVVCDNDVNIFYSDNGHGLTSEGQKKIFDPFYTTKRGQGGSGLGTHIVFNLVENLGGGISIIESNAKGLHYHLKLKT